MIISDAEPIEVFILKKHLANLTCSCSFCEKQSWSGSSNEESNVSDKGTQVNFAFNYNLKNSIDDKVDVLCNNVSCPSCYIALNLLRNRETKVCKDECTETNLSCCDKFTEKYVKFIETTTSMPSLNKPANKDSGTTGSGKNASTTTMNGIMKKRSNEHVSFSDNFGVNDVTQENVNAFQGSCFCLQNFMESIRPPLTDDTHF